MTTHSDQSAPDDSPKGERTEAFLRLLTEHEKTFSIYVTGLVRSIHDAQDILQDGKIIMWRYFDKFELGTNFLAWGRKILFHQILAYRRKAKKEQHTYLSEETIGVLDQQIEMAMKEKRWVDREAALQVCLQKMKLNHREIIRMRYRDEFSIESISRETKKSETAIYQLLYRLRIALFDCVEISLKPFKM